MIKNYHTPGRLLIKRGIKKIQIIRDNSHNSHNHSLLSGLSKSKREVNKFLQFTKKFFFTERRKFLILACVSPSPLTQAKPKEKTKFYKCKQFLIIITRRFFHYYNVFSILNQLLFFIFWYIFISITTILLLFFFFFFRKALIPFTRFFLQSFFIILMIFS